MKLRVGQIIAVAAISAVVLFGGWFAYRQWAIEAPLMDIASSYEGVNHVQMDITFEEIYLKLDLNPGANVRDFIRQLEQDGRKMMGDRTLRVEVEDRSTAALDDIWQEALFPIAQAMENKQYTNIQTTLSKLEEKYQLLETIADMDDKNVYVTLSDGKASKYIILPRIPEKMGVWPNA